MANAGLLKQIADKEYDREKIVARVIKNPKLLPDVIGCLDGNKPALRFGSLNVLRLLSVRNPEILYPEIDVFIKLLDSEKSVFQWGAIFIIGSLAAVDSKGRISKIFDRYFAPITGPDLIPAANVIQGASRIAAAKPRLAAKIAKELLKVEKAEYKTPACRNVVLGQAIEAFDGFFHKLKEKAPVARFVRRQLENSRKSTARSAERFLKRHGLSKS
jgi:hypothetical protein